jgi:hypothetical protein
MMNFIYFKLVLLSLITFSYGADGACFKAVVRAKNAKAKEKCVILKDLISSDSFEGKYFKIVVGKNNDAIKFDADDDIKLKAATTYYHLSLARDYFVNQMNSSYLKSLAQITIRIELTNKFSELGHFAHDNLDPQYNNALSIPAGRGIPGRDIKPWEMEIWFRPKKIIYLKDLNIKQENIQDFNGVLRVFREQVHMMSLQRFMLGMVNQPNFLAGQNIVDNMIRTVGASVLMETIYQGSGPINRLFQRKRYWLDAALVPEIIYHEFAHIALSDHLELTHSTPVNEGMADYFAGVIADNAKLASKIKKHNTFSGKNARNKKSYALQFETTGYANTDFVFGLLWSFRSFHHEKFSDRFVYLLREHLTTNSTIHNDLLSGMLNLCDQVCLEPAGQRLNIYQLFYHKGL